MLRKYTIFLPAVCAMLFALGVRPAAAQVTFSSPTAPAGLRTTCVSTTGVLSFDPSSTSTCAGAQTGITGITINNGGGFSATGTAGVTVVGSGVVTTNSGNISSATGNITTASGTVQGATVNSTGAMSVGTNLTVNGALNMTNGAISNVTNLSGDGTGSLSGFVNVTGTGAGNVSGFSNITGTGKSARELQTLMLEKAGVATVAGTSFGVHGEGYVRFSYANSIENIRLAMQRVGTLLTEI